MGVSMLTGTANAGVTSAITSIAEEITATVGAVAPIAIGIVGVFLVWKFGMKFFKSLSK